VRLRVHGQAEAFETAGTDEDEIGGFAENHLVDRPIRAELQDGKADAALHYPSVRENEPAFLLGLDADRS